VKASEGRIGLSETVGDDLVSMISMKELLQAGAHFGRQTKRCNPKMKEYILGERHGIHIIDLEKTVKMFDEASWFMRELAAQGKIVLFVGTKREAKDIIAEEASRAGMFYINRRWLGGILTNWPTVQKAVKRLVELDVIAVDGNYELLPTKEVIKLKRERNQLRAHLAGIKNMRGLPDALFVIDSNKEQAAVNEARKLGIPVISVVDTICDPGSVDYPIPGNDDTLRAIRLFSSKIADAVIEGSMGKGEVAFTVAADPGVSPEDYVALLSVLADYFRACGGLGFKVDLNGESEHTSDEAREEPRPQPKPKGPLLEEAEGV
jgi:small subunit ribosomal protein S2